MANTIYHPNEVLIHTDDDKSTAKEYTIIGATQVLVGKENPNEEEILTDEETGLNYKRNKVEAVEVYSLHKTKKHNWLIIDLQTGHKGWYPGCDIHADITDTEAVIREYPDISAKILETVSSPGIIVTVLDITDINDEPEDENWYRVKDGHTIGYVQKEYVTNLRYENPF